MGKRNDLMRKIAKIVNEDFQRKGLFLDKVVLFGSYAQGRQGPESDIDLIIVSRDFRGKRLMEKVELASGLNWQLVHQTKKPFDLLYYSDLEWKKGSSVIISAVKKQGRVLFG
jgi:uncharacterized protein